MMTRQTKIGGVNKPLSQRGAARILKVTQEHLNRCLRGHRNSKRLVALYNELMTLQAGEMAVNRTNNKDEKATKR